MDKKAWGASRSFSSRRGSLKTGGGKFKIKMLQGWFILIYSGQVSLLILGVLPVEGPSLIGL